LEVGTGFNPELTGRENIYLNGAILGMTRTEITSKLDEIIDFSGCERYVDTPTKRYSSGMTVRLAFAVAAHLEPEILVVDEVLAVGDAEFQKKAIGKMQDISRGDGRTVLFVSHNMASVQNLCTRGILLEHGKVAMDDKVDHVVERYLSLKKRGVQKKVTFNTSHRRDELVQTVKLLSIEIQTESPTVRDELDFKIEIKVHKDIDVKVGLTGSICTYDDQRVGSFFTEPCTVHTETKHLQLNLNNHNLSVGAYYLNISLATGEVIEGNLKTIDHAYNAIGFEILKERESGRYLTEWNSNWGKIFFPSTLTVQ
ncbi:MAG: ABC transporter ATP-binding protein, partial [Leeuwenhoekiella sp.]